MCGSACFGRLSAHHQERTTALESCGSTVGAYWLECGGCSVVGRGLAGYNLPDHDQQRSNHHTPTNTLQR
jgi:hypothetical protein